MIRRYSTKSEYEKEQEEVERLSRPAPQNKPPRQDLRRNRIKVHDPDIDGVGNDGSTKDPDLSMNYKKVGRVVDRYLLKISKRAPAHKPGDVWQPEGSDTWSAKNKDGDSRSGFKTEEKAKAFAEGSSRMTESDLPEGMRKNFEDLIGAIKNEKLAPGQVELRVRQRLLSLYEDDGVTISDEDAEIAVKALLEFAADQPVNKDNVKAYFKYKIKGPDKIKKTKAYRMLEESIPDTSAGKWWKNYLSNAPLVSVDEFQDELDKNLDYLKEQGVGADELQNLHDVGWRIQRLRTLQDAKAKGEDAPDEWVDLEKSASTESLLKGLDLAKMIPNPAGAQMLEGFLPDNIFQMSDRELPRALSQVFKDLRTDGYLDFEGKTLTAEDQKKIIAHIKEKVKEFHTNEESIDEAIEEKANPSKEDDLYSRGKGKGHGFGGNSSESKAETLKRLLSEFQIDGFALTDAEIQADGINQLSTQATEQFLEMSAKGRKKAAEQLYVALKVAYPKDSPQHKQALAILDGLKIACALRDEEWEGEPGDQGSLEYKIMDLEGDLDDEDEDGEDGQKNKQNKGQGKKNKGGRKGKDDEDQELVPKLDPLMVAVIKAQYREGHLSDLFKTGDESIFAKYPGNRAALRGSLDRLTDIDIVEALGGDRGPYSSMIEQMQATDTSQADREWISQWLRERVLEDATFVYDLVDSALTSKKQRKQKEDAAERSGKKTKAKNIPTAQAIDEIRNRALASKPVQRAFRLYTECNKTRGADCSKYELDAMKAPTAALLAELEKEGFDIEDKENPLMVQALDALNQPTIKDLQRAMDAEYRVRETEDVDPWEELEKAQNPDKQTPTTKQSYAAANFYSRQGRYLAYIYTDQNRGVSRARFTASELSLGEYRMSRKLTKESALTVTSNLNKVANIIQKDYKTLGIPQKIAMDYAYRTDLLSDFIEKRAGVDPDETSITEGYLDTLETDGVLAKQESVQKIIAAEHSVHSAALKVAKHGRRSMVANLTRLASVLMRMQADIVAGYGNDSKVAEVLDVVSKVMPHVNAVDEVEGEQELKKVARLIDLAVRLARKAEDENLDG